MFFKKCDRCGNLFVSESNICQNCIPIDNCEANKLKDYLSNNTIDNPSINNLSYNTGISTKNLTRHLQNNNINNN